jgi:signal transduction histidine kinase
MWLAFGLMLSSLALIPLLLLVADWGASELERLILALALALILALIQALIWLQLRPHLFPSEEHLSANLHNFVERISGVVELDELIQLTMRQLEQMYGITRGSLILVAPSKRTSDSEGYMVLIPHPIGLGDIPKIEDEVTMSGALLRRLLIERRPLLRRDVENPAFALSDTERAFFRQMSMEIYTPVVAQGNFIGLLAISEAHTGRPYEVADVDVLLTISNQMGTVLRNARLVEDLQRREKEVTEANTQLNVAKEQLEQLDGVKTDFITIASHELRTPLAQIRGYTDIITALNDQGMLDPEQLSTMTGNLRKASDRMEELIRNMLDVSQLDVNAMDLRFGNVTLSNVVKMAIEPYTESVRSRKLSVAVRGLRDLPEIQADLKRLVQAFQNVIMNAVKFTPDGGRIDVEGSIKTNPETGGDEIVIAIKDTGIGIDKKNLEIIFEKFVRTQDPSLHSTGKTKFMGAGPGLGLTIARGVLAGHGGRIWAESPGYDPEGLPGSTFFIALPLQEEVKRTGVVQLDASSTSPNIDREELMRRMQEQAAQAPSQA